MSEFEFTNTWFDSTAKGIWEQIVPQLRPSKILEIGSYEGASTCFLIKTLAPLFPIEIHCVDTWEGGIEHTQGTFQVDMSAVETRFHKNMKIATDEAPNKVDLVLHKGYSDMELAKMLVGGKDHYFDMIYVDGSHQSPDVIVDAVLGFRLLKIGGVMIFDDYLWAERRAEGPDIVASPKLAIDSFTNMYCRKIKFLSMPLYQLYIQKASD